MFRRLVIEPRKITTSPGHPKRHKPVPAIAQIGHSTIVIPLPIPTPVTLSREPQRWNQNNVRVRRLRPYRFLYPECTLYHLRIRRPHTKLQRRILLYYHRQRNTEPFLFYKLNQQRAQIRLTFKRPERRHMFRYLTACFHECRPRRREPGE